MFDINRYMIEMIFAFILVFILGLVCGFFFCAFIRRSPDRLSISYENLNKSLEEARNLIDDLEARKIEQDCSSHLTNERDSGK